MAAADITYSIFHLSELIFQHISNKPEGMSGPGFCFLRNPGIQWIGASCSALTLVVVAFERYLVVRNPHGNQKVSTEKLKVGMSFSLLGPRKPGNEGCNKLLHTWPHNQAYKSCK